MRTLLLGLLGCLALSCAALGNYTRSAFGTEGGYSLRNAKPRPVSLMVAQKLERPRYLVIDDLKVRDTWPLETSGCAVGSFSCERFNLLDAQQFVRRDLKAALENYFMRVEVVDSAAALPATPHFVADVKIDDVRMSALVRGALTYQLIEMTWAFAMRGNEQVEFAYSFAGTAQSNDSYPTFKAGCATLVENAIPAMLKRWVEGGGVEAFRTLGGGAPARAITET